MLTFGPVPSRRLGRSIGINSIPPKTCSYACVYCQIGRTTKFSAERAPFYTPEAIGAALEERLEKVRESKDSVDYVTFVPDGEPTLDSKLSETHGLVKAMGIKTAIITNGSLMGREDVRRDLMNFDLVSIKVDSVIRDVWLHVDRPHPGLDLEDILKGSVQFAKEYRGRLLTETMLVDDLNDGEESLRLTAEHIGRMKPYCAYISIPTRPPTEKWVRIPTTDALTRAYSIFSDHTASVELLTGYEGNAFASTGNPEADLLDITAVHPMRRDAVEELLARAGAEWPLVDRLLDAGAIRQASWGGQDFFIRTPAVKKTK